MNKLRKTKSKTKRKTNERKHKLVSGRKHQHGGIQRPPNPNYKENLLVAAGVDTNPRIDKTEAEEFLLKALKKSFYDFKERKQDNSEEYIFSEDEKATMQTEYITFMNDVQKHNFDDFRTKNNTICFFLAMLFQKYMMNNPYYLEKMEAIKAIIFNKNIKNSQQKATEFLFKTEIDTVPDSVSRIQKYIKEKNKYEILFTDKKYFIRLHASSLETILTAFTKGVFFVGLENKEVITHDGILLPFAYIHHDLMHYNVLNTNYNIVNVNLLTKFLNFIKNKQNSYHVYLILYLSIFENQCTSYKTVTYIISELIPLIDNSIKNNNVEGFKYASSFPLSYDCICAFLRFDITKNDFESIIEKLDYYKQLYLVHFYDKLEHLVNEHFLLSLLPKNLQTDVTKQTTQKNKVQLVTIYIYECILTFFEYYKAFMFPSSIPYYGRIPLSLQNSTPSTPATLLPNSILTQNESKLKADTIKSVNKTNDE